MARLSLSSLSLALAFTGQAYGSKVGVFGTSWNLENRQTAADGWSFIPNYDYPGCDQFITYRNQTPSWTSTQPTYSDAGAATTLWTRNATGQFNELKTGGCCGLGVENGRDIFVQAYGTFVQRQACGPDYWPFSEALDLRGQPGNAIQRCINAVPTTANPNAGQQTPIDIRTFASPAITNAAGTVISPGVPATPMIPITINTGSVSSTGLTFNAQLGSIIPWFTGGPCPATFTPLAGAWQMNFDPTTCNLETTVGTKKFRLVQFHFHNGEHTINGLQQPIEVHYVHVAINGTSTIDINQPLVLGAFLSTGTYKNFFLEKLIQNFNNPTTRNQPILINPYQFILTVKNSYWHYKGSLTTPPCQTNNGAFVRWFVFKKPIVVSWQQGQFLTQYFNDLKKSYNAQTNRPVNAILPSTQIYSYGMNPWP